MRTIGIAAAVGLLAAPALAGAPALWISEIRIDEPGADLNEYFEIAGAPGTSLDGLAYIVIGDAPGVVPPAQNGTIEAVVDLSGLTIPASGVLLVAESTFTLGTPDLVASINFEELDNVTHLLVSGFTGANGQDLDTNDDGTLDVTPWDGVIDSVALILNANPNGITADFFYSATTVGPDGAFTPSQAWRCPDTLAWNIGSFAVSATDTPGAANPECAGTPAIAINEIRGEQPGPDNDEYFELLGAPGTPLTGSPTSSSATAPRGSAA